MTVAEWRTVSARMMRRWPHADWPTYAKAGVVDQMLADLADLDGDAVARAVDTLARDGLRFPPTAGEIRAKAIDLALDTPEWATVKAELCRPVEVNHAQPNACPAGECDGSGMVDVEGENACRPCRCRELRARRRHPLVAEFLAVVGRDEFGDLAGDRTAEAQTREKWTAFVRARRRDEAYVGLPGGLPMLDRINEAPRQLADVLADVRPTAALAAGENQ